MTHWCYCVQAGVRCDIDRCKCKATPCKNLLEEVSNIDNKFGYLIQSISGISKH